MQPIKFSAEELAAFREEYAAGANDAQFTLFVAECERRGLVPGQHIVFQLRTSKEWDADTGSNRFVKKMVKITTIDALRLISQRTGEYEGQGEGEFYYLDDKNQPTIVSKIPLPHPTQANAPREPWAAAIPIYRRGFREPVKVVARFDAYAVTFKDKQGTYRLNEVWARRGPEMLLKCSEAAARRACFPEDCSGLFISEEFERPVDDTPHVASVTPASVVPLPPPVPAVNQTPAQGIEAPRPNEERAAAEVAKEQKMARDIAEARKAFDKAREEATPTETGNAAYADKMTPEEVNQHSQALAKKEAKPEKKQTRKAKPEEAVPEKPVDGGITDEDLKTLDAPPPIPVDEEQIKKEADEFIEAIDPTPTKEEQHGFTTRVRALSAAGAKSEDLKNYILNVGKKSDTKQLTIRDWRQALDQLEAAQADGKLVEVSKAAPLPAF